ncbi:hypothetical protein HDU81_000746, partial [Chytriomyces hyalinus]
SIVMADYDEMIKLPIYEPGMSKRSIHKPAIDTKSETQEYLEYNAGAGVQHIALSTNDIIKSVSNLRARGVEFMPVPALYYLHLAERLEARNYNVVEPLAVLEQLGILVDYDSEGYLLQIFTKPVEDRPTLSIEIIQRVKSEGFGARNFYLLSMPTLLKPRKEYALLPPRIVKEHVEVWNATNEHQLDYTNLSWEEECMVLAYSADNYMFHQFHKPTFERHILARWQSAEEWNKAPIDDKRQFLKSYRALSASPGFLNNREEFLKRAVHRGITKAVVIEDAKLAQTIEKQALFHCKRVRSDIFDTASIQVAIAASVRLDADVVSRLLRGDFKYILPYPSDSEKLSIIESTKTDKGDLDAMHLFG